MYPVITCNNDIEDVTFKMKLKWVDIYLGTGEVYTSYLCISLRSNQQCCHACPHMQSKQSATLLGWRAQRLQHILLVEWEHPLCTLLHLRSIHKYRLKAQIFICIQTVRSMMTIPVAKLSFLSSVEWRDSYLGLYHTSVFQLTLDVGMEWRQTLLLGPHDQQ